MKGVILAAGYATRFLPASKTIPKEMFPLIDRPAIDFIVQEMADSGIRDILLVSSRRKKVMEDYFDREVELSSAFSQSNEFEKLMSTEREDLEMIEEIGPVTAENVFFFFRDTEKKQFIADFIARGVKPMEEQILKISDSHFFGKTVVLTGTLSEPREVWKKRLILAGAKVSSSVSSKTDYLLAGENAGSKMLKAEKMEVSVIDEEVAIDFLENEN